MLLIVLVGLVSMPARGEMQDNRQRGEYLVNIMGCNDCHTPMGPDGRPLMQFKLAGHPPGAPVAVYQGGPVGSFALTNTSWAGPWGVSFSRNLTPDPETGLGKWTEADFLKVARTGQKPNGALLLPPMPWPNLAALTASDLKAMWAYLRSLPPIKNAVPENLPPPAPKGK
jgi:mono/diheme cytochrome c family protein